MAIKIGDTHRKELVKVLQGLVETVEELDLMGRSQIPSVYPGLDQETLLLLKNARTHARVLDESEEEEGG